MDYPLILLIEDEEQIRNVLDITLQSDNYRVLQAATAKEGIALAASQSPDLILLDLGLPDQSGHDVLIHLREWFKKPIVILSAQNSEENIIKALDNGANDYLIKPYRSAELLARLRSAIYSSVSELKNAVFKDHGLEINFAMRTVKKNDLPIKLTVTEYNMLSLFVRNEGKVLTHHYLLNQLQGKANDVDLQYLRVYIGQLRKKIENNPNRPDHIITESGVGYRFIGQTK